MPHSRRPVSGDLPGMPVYAGHLKTVVLHHHTHAETAPNFDSDFSYQSLGLMMCDHGPTHVDAISHLDPRADAPTIDVMPLDTFWGIGTCLDISDVPPREYCTAERLDQAVADSASEFRQGDVLLRAPGRPSDTAARVKHHSIPGARPERRRLARGAEAEDLRRRLAEPGQSDRTGCTPCICCAAAPASRTTRTWPTSSRWSAGGSRSTAFPCESAAVTALRCAP